MGNTPTGSLVEGLKYLSQPEGVAYYTPAVTTCSVHVLACLFAGEFTVKELSVWVVVDLDTNQGRHIALDALNYTVSGIQLVGCLSRFTNLRMVFSS